MEKRKADMLLPLTETTAYILLALRTPLHGYGVMQKVTEMSEGIVKLGAGTLYGAVATLEKQALILKAGEDGRRKLYKRTEFGTEVLTEHIRRTMVFIQNREVL